MKKLVFLSLLLPLFANAQIIIDTTYALDTNGLYTIKIVGFRNAMTTTLVPKQDTVVTIATAYRLKIKTDSLAAVIAGILATKQAIITTGTTAQYFRGDLSLATFPTTTAAFSNSTNKNFVTDAQATVIGNTLNSNSGDNATNTTYANDYRAANFVAGTNYLAPNGSAASLTSFPTLNQNTTGTASNVTSVVSFANGGISASAATSATTGTMTVNMTTSIVTITPTGACTFNASGGVAGQVITFAITTSGTSSFVLTWGTNFRKVGTLATGTVSARFFSVTFICINGTTWQEIGRTAVQT